MAGKRGAQAGSDEARRGGQAVLERYGVDFYRTIGRKGGTKVRGERGLGFYREMGKRGGAATSRQMGPDFYSRIGKKGAQARKVKREQAAGGGADGR